MPSATVEATTETFTRVIAALRARLDPDDIAGLTDGQVWKLDLKRYYTELVYGYERRVAQGAITPDDDIVEVT